MINIYDLVFTIEAIDNCVQDKWVWSTDGETAHAESSWHDDPRRAEFEAIAFLSLEKVKGTEFAVDNFRFCIAMKIFAIGEDHLKLFLEDGSTIDIEGAESIGLFHELDILMSDQDFDNILKRSDHSAIAVVNAHDCYQFLF